VSLELHARRAQNRKTLVTGHRGCFGKQSRLSHTRLAAEDEGTPRAFDSVEERGEQP
jgi:hypothetical protein